MASDNKQAESVLGLVRVRPSAERGHANHGWLNTYHTFSFANYFDPQYEKFYSLRVLNEDRVRPGTGFGAHSHRNFEIFSYVVSGELTHRDSMGNVEVCGRGHVQFTSAGSGMRHSEFNENDSEVVHFVQIWVAPSRSFLEPSYQMKHFSDEDKYGKLCLLVSPEPSDTTIKINQDVKVYATLLKNGEEIKYEACPGRSVYVHVVQDATGMRAEADQVGITLNNVRLSGGDGAFVTSASKYAPMGVTLVGNSKNDEVRAEVLVFDISNT
eukprot:TRINITY_DN9415_c0_g2_i5.p1 TRINITY_DN9415_c0_g2~~TRINITY_DN9415_c0_g2_i5.p1  ORF type:complete len:269 (+),score=58.25 TRINITY_DN9415_c0_g2_i5:119-925(+)